MHRKLSAGRLLVASHNAGKVREIADLLHSFPLDVVSASEFGLPEPEETADSFAGNAALKALAAATAAGLPALADDSGLAVDALGGAPGIHSARWGGPGRDFGHAMEKVEVALTRAGATSDSRRRAHFCCALALAWPDGHCESFVGKVDGRVVWPPRGTRGFGYDPIFVAEGFDITFGEMEPSAKHAISHRADAFRQLVAACLTP